MLTAAALTPSRCRRPVLFSQNRARIRSRRRPPSLSPPERRPKHAHPAPGPPAENTPRSPHSHALVLEQLRAPSFLGMERPGPVDTIHHRPPNVQERGEQLKPPPLTSVSLFVLALVLSAHSLVLSMSITTHV